jgi:hypothetical protein
MTAYGARFSDIFSPACSFEARVHACDQLYSFWDASFIPVDTVNCVATLQVWQPPAQFRLVHSNISNTVAAGLGIKSLIQFVVGPSTDGDLQPYGQEESLTSRLAGLLEVYPDGPSIFKELVQNADDAGASTVKIVIDMKQWGTTSVLGEDMAGWQGPVRVLRQIFTLEDAIGAHVCSCETNMCVTNNIPLGSSLPYRFALNIASKY